MEIKCSGGIPLWMTQILSKEHIYKTSFSKYVSRFCTLKTGDLIFTGTPAGVGEAKIGTHLKGYIGDEKVLDFHVR